MGPTGTATDPWTERWGSLSARVSRFPFRDQLETHGTQTPVRKRYPQETRAARA